MSVGDFNVLQISCKIVSYEAQDLHSEKIIRKIIYEEFGKNFLLNWISFSFVSFALQWAIWVETRAVTQVKDFCWADI